MLNIGDRVLCVNSAKRPETQEELSQDVPNWVVKGEKYTIRGFTNNNGIVEGVWLEEIVNPMKFFRLLNRTAEPAFRLDRFEKMVEDFAEEKVEQLEKIL